MKKLIALILFVVLFLVGILLLAFGINVGLLLLIVGLLGTVMMGIILGSRGFVAHITTPRGFYDPFLKDKVDKQAKDQPVNVWDQMAEQKDTE